MSDVLIISSTYFCFLIQSTHDSAKAEKLISGPAHPSLLIIICFPGLHYSFDSIRRVLYPIDFHVAKMK